MSIGFAGIIIGEPKENRIGYIRTMIEDTEYSTYRLMLIGDESYDARGQV